MAQLPSCRCPLHMNIFFCIPWKFRPPWNVEFLGLTDAWFWSKMIPQEVWIVELSDFFKIYFYFWAVSPSATQGFFMDYDWNCPCHCFIKEQPPLCAGKASPAAQRNFHFLHLHFKEHDGNSDKMHQKLLIFTQKHKFWSSRPQDLQIFGIFLQTGRFQAFSGRI